MSGDNHVNSVSIVDVNTDGAIRTIIECMQNEPVIMEASGVYALLAQPTLKGVAILDKTKNRLPNKWYTSCIGDLSAFVRSIPADALPDELRADDGKLIESAFNGNHVRVRLASANVNTPVICRGLHQAFICTGGFRRFFTECERAFRSDDANALFAGAQYSGCLGSSANISGTPSITEKHHAIEFAHARGVRMIITDRNIPAVLPEKRGSLSIFGINRHEIVLLRRGAAFSEDDIASKLPSHLIPKVPAVVQ